MRLIDFEYAGPNHIAYDIGNHFCEFAGIENVDYSQYPDEDLQKQWLRNYLEEAASLKGKLMTVLTETVSFVWAWDLAYRICDRNIFSW